MRFFILNTDYPEFLRWLYVQHPGLEKRPYEEQMRVRVESLFGVADFYSSNLRKLGHEAYDIHANNEFMQKAWAKEHGIHIEELTSAKQRARAVLQRARQIATKTPLRSLKPVFRPVLRSLESQPTWFYDILAAQIKHYKPDVVLNQAMDGISSRFLQEMKPYVRLRTFVQDHELGEVHVAPLPVRLWPGKIREPDVLFVAREHSDRIGEQFFGVPDLVMEVTSSSTRRTDRVEKLVEYAQAEVEEYWIVDPEARTVEVFTLREGAYEALGKWGTGETARSALLAGFEVAVDEMMD